MSFFALSPDIKDITWPLSVSEEPILVIPALRVFVFLYSFQLDLFILFSIPYFTFPPVVTGRDALDKTVPVMLLRILLGLLSRGQFFFAILQVLRQLLRFNFKSLNPVKVMISFCSKLLRLVFKCHHLFVDCIQGLSFFFKLFLGGSTCSRVSHVVDLFSQNID